MKSMLSVDLIEVAKKIVANWIWSRCENTTVVWIWQSKLIKSTVETIWGWSRCNVSGCWFKWTLQNPAKVTRKAIWMPFEVIWPLIFLLHSSHSTTKSSFHTTKPIPHIRNRRALGYIFTYCSQSLNLGLQKKNSISSWNCAAHSNLTDNERRLLYS